MSTIAHMMRMHTVVVCKAKLQRNDDEGVRPKGDISTVIEWRMHAYAHLQAARDVFKMRYVVAFAAHLTGISGRPDLYGA